MNVSFNRDHLTIKFNVTKEAYEEDLLTGMRFERLLENKDFKALTGEWIKADQLYKEAIMKVGMTDADSRMTGKKAAAYNGFNEGINLIQKYIMACNQYRKDEIKRIDEELAVQSGEEISIAD